MKKNKTNDSKQYPDFVLCDMGLQSAFAQMCQNFQKKTLQNPQQDWLIIDNDTGQIITPENDK